MTKTSGTVVFFGNERLATGVTTSAPTLRALIDAGYDVACVITNYPDIQSRHRRELEIIEVARQHNIPVWLPDKLSDVKRKLETTGATLGVLAAYGKIVPQNIIDLFSNGIINIHPSLLPKHRGPTPIESVLLSGEAVTGVSLMMLANRLDAGPVISQRKIRLNHQESKQSLAERLIKLGADILIQHLPDIMNGNATTTPQNDSDATYDRLIEKNDGAIDWQKPAAQLEREVRAYLGWPKSRCDLDNKKFIITAAKVSDDRQNDLNRIAGTPLKLSRNTFGVQTVQGVLEIEKLKPEGKSEMTAQAYLAGYGQRLKLVT
jgi:methionyl-tRNA formyltransferase